MIDVFPERVAVSYRNYSNPRLSSVCMRGLLESLEIDQQSRLLNMRVILSNRHDHYELSKKIGGLTIALPPELHDYARKMHVSSYVLSGAPFSDILHVLPNKTFDRLPVSMPVIQSMARITLAAERCELPGTSGELSYPIIDDPNVRIARVSYKRK